MEIEEKKRIAQAFLRLIGDPDQRHEALAMMNDDATWWIPGAGVFDKQQIAASFARIDTIFTGPIVVTVTGLTAEGDRVAIESEGDVDAVNGRHYNNRYHTLIVFHGDKIGEVKEYCDTQYVQDVLGDLLGPA